MRFGIASCVVVGLLSSSALASQGRTGNAAAANGAPPACSILTKDLVLPFTENPKLLDIVKPEEEPMTAGSACEWGVVRLQLYRFQRIDTERKAPDKEWLPLTGAGEKAYFRNNGNHYAEMIVWSGPYQFTLQVGVPVGGTAEAMKPKTVSLANAVITKLR